LAATARQLVGAQEIKRSVVQNCKNKAIDAFTYLSNAFRGVLGSLFA
jgi:hypothetical protein